MGRMIRGEFHIHPGFLRRVTGRGSGFTYKMYLGYNMGSAISNLFQNMATIGEVGFLNWVKASDTWWDDVGKALRAEFVDVGTYVPEFMSAEAAVRMGRGQSLFSPMGLFGKSELFNKGQAFSAGFKIGAKRLRRGEISKLQRYARHNLLLDEQMEINELIRAKKYHEAAVAVGQGVMAKTQYVYLKSHMPLILQTTLGRTFTFSSYPLQTLHLFSHWFVNNPTAAIRYLAYSGSVYVGVKELLGIDLKDKFFEAMFRVPSAIEDVVMGRGLGPMWQTALAAARVAVGYKSAIRDLKRQAQSYGMTAQGRRLWKFIQLAENDWEIRDKNGKFIDRANEWDEILKLFGIPTVAVAEGWKEYEQRRKMMPF